MANILPGESLRQMRGFYRSRLIYVASLVMIVCGVVTVVALIPAYAVVTGGRVESAAEPLEDSSVEREDIARAQSLLRELRGVASSTPVLVSFVGAALSARPAGVSVRAAHFVREEATLTISGMAASREAINEYRATLSKNPTFKNVSVPIAALAGAKEGHFTITVTRAP